MPLPVQTGSGGGGTPVLKLASSHAHILGPASVAIGAVIAMQRAKHNEPYLLHKGRAARRSLMKDKRASAAQGGGGGGRDWNHEAESYFAGSGS
jgi:hypothetical protein